MKLKLIIFLTTIPIGLVTLAQSTPAPQQQQQKVQEPVQGGWYSAPAPVSPTTTGSTDDKEEGTKERSIDVQQEYQQMRMERSNSLARTKGKLTEADRRRMEDQAGRLQEHAPNSFEAHMAAFYAEFPSPASFQHLDRASMRDPSRPELIGPKLADAARRDNSMEMTQWSRALRDRGEVAPGLWLFADDLLASVDNGGILLAAGEMDAYPVWTRQYADGRRRDVLVIDTRLIGDPAYRLRIWERAKAKGNVPDEASFFTRLAAATSRPLHLSPALGKERMPFPQDQVYVVGLTLRHSLEPLDNVPLIEQRWAGMNKTMQAGPLSQNYLVPAIALLRHYRQADDETNASRMEHEVRRMAKELGVENELYRTGVLEH